MTRAAYALAPLLALVLAGCQRDAGPAAEAPPPASPAADAAAATGMDPAGPGMPDESVVESRWQCGEQHLSARFDNGAGTVTLTHERGELVLPQARSASGARYADANGNEFWNKGDRATLTLSGQEAQQCQEVAAGTG